MATKGTWKYRKLERTPQVGKDAGSKKYCAIAAYRLWIKDFLFFFLLILFSILSRDHSFLCSLLWRKQD